MCGHASTITPSPQASPYTCRHHSLQHIHGRASHDCDHMVKKTRPTTSWASAQFIARSIEMDSPHSPPRLGPPDYPHTPYPSGLATHCLCPATRKPVAAASVPRSAPPLPTSLRRHGGTQDPPRSTTPAHHVQVSSRALPTVLPPWTPRASTWLPVRHSTTTAMGLVSPHAQNDDVTVDDDDEATSVTATTLMATTTTDDNEGDGDSDNTTELVMATMTESETRRRQRRGAGDVMSAAAGSWRRDVGSSGESGTRCQQRRGVGDSGRGVASLYITCR
ncbi:hypothetical protein EDB85DRAFT_1900448 [Lactarius pseudohatsudake]|nr:hypothetical protein EDB85DRAFT_1900448 [Lactarius pseudohatsudake]